MTNSSARAPLGSVKKVDGRRKNGSALRWPARDPKIVARRTKKPTTNVAVSQFRVCALMLHAPCKTGPREQPQTRLTTVALSDDRRSIVRTFPSTRRTWSTTDGCAHIHEGNGSWFSTRQSESLPAHRVSPTEPDERSRRRVDRRLRRSSGAQPATLRAKFSPSLARFPIVGGAWGRRPYLIRTSADRPTSDKADGPGSRRRPKPRLRQLRTRGRDAGLTKKRGRRAIPRALSA